MSNCGFSQEEAIAIENNYHELYKVSTKWVKDKIAQASIDGYALGAFGLRIRCPLLNQVLLGKSSTPYEASAEARTLGNAISGQSFGLLTNRAGNEFMHRVWASPYRYQIKLAAFIHDAIYMYFPCNSDILKWVNDNLIECMEWQELPEIQHSQVKLGAELDIYYPSWKDVLTLPNNQTKEQLIKQVKEYKDQL